VVVAVAVSARPDRHAAEPPDALRVVRRADALPIQRKARWARLAVALVGQPDAEWWGVDAAASDIAVAESVERQDPSDGWRPNPAASMQDPAERVRGAEIRVAARAACVVRNPPNPAARVGAGPSESARGASNSAPGAPAGRGSQRVWTSEARSASPAVAPESQAFWVLPELRACQE